MPKRPRRKLSTSEIKGIKQKIFDDVAIGLLKQMKRSFIRAGGVREEPICRYRYGELKCAVGHLIPDDKYSPTMEGHAVWFPEVRERLPDRIQAAISLDRDVLSLLTDLQGLHDNKSPTVWEDGFETIATKFHLSPNVLSNEG